MKSLILLIALIICSASVSMAAEISFTVEKGYLIIPVKIKKDIQAEMVVATGSDVSLIDFGAVEKYKFRLSYTGVGIITGSNDRTVTFSEITDLVVGDEKSSSLNARLSEMDSIKKKVGRDIIGVLGADFLKGKIVKFDFKKRVLSFLKQSDEKIEDKSKISDTIGKTPNQLSYKMTYFKPNIFNNEIYLPVSDEVYINGRKMKALFDTIIAFPIFILPSGVKDIGLEAPEKETAKNYQLDSLKCFDTEMKDVPAVLVGKNSSFDRDTKEYNSIIGLGIMQNFSITFDFKKKLIILEK